MGCVLSVVFGVLEGGVCFGDRDFQTASSLSLASPLRAAKQGRGEFVPRGSPNKRLLPRIPKLSPLCTISLSVTTPSLPVLRGVSGGGAALSPGFDFISVRRSNTGLTQRRSPLSGLSFSLFFFLRRKKKRLLSATQSENLCQ